MLIWWFWVLGAKRSFISLTMGARSNLMTFLFFFDFFPIFSKKKKSNFFWKVVFFQKLGFFPKSEGAWVTHWWRTAPKNRKCKNSKENKKKTDSQHFLKTTPAFFEIFQKNHFWVEKISGRWFFPQIMKKKFGSKFFKKI